MMRRLCGGLAAMLLFATTALADDVPVRPVETTVVSFDQQIANVEGQTGFNASLQVRNFPDRGLLVVTPRETFASGNLHVIFVDGTTKALKFHVDPTATLEVRLSSLPTTDLSLTPPSATAAMPAAVVSQSKLVFTPPSAPAETAAILTMLNRLQDAKPVRLRYKRPLPFGLSASVTRVLSLNQNLVYEIEVQNTSTASIYLRASQFDHGLTEAVYISGMDHYGTLLLAPKDLAFVYVSDIDAR